MNRERALQIVLILVGLLFTVLVYPMWMLLWQEPALSMMLSLYVTLGIFLLIASRNPSEHRSLIAFTAWSSIAHAVVMAIQTYRMPEERMHFLIGSGVLAVIWIVLVALAPAKQPKPLATAVRA